MIILRYLRIRYLGVSILMSDIAVRHSIRRPSVTGFESRALCILQEARKYAFYEAVIEISLLIVLVTFFIRPYFNEHNSNRPAGFCENVFLVISWQHRRCCARNDLAQSITIIFQQIAFLQYRIFRNIICHKLQQTCPFYNVITLRVLMSATTIVLTSLRLLRRIYTFQKMKEVVLRMGHYVSDDLMPHRAQSLAANVCWSWWLYVLAPDESSNCRMIDLIYSS